MRRLLTTCLAAAVLLTAASAATATCPSLYEVSDNGGKTWLGINADGYMAGEGQTVHVDCGGALTDISFKLVLDGETWNGAPPLGSGDMLIASIRIPGVMTLGTAMATIDFNLGSQWIAFDFASQGLDLSAGDYLVTCAPVTSGQARLAYWQGEDSYAEGVRYVSEGGDAGPWIAIGSEFGDLAVRLELDVPTPAESASWSEVKSLFR